MQAKQIHPAPPPQAWAPSDAQRACVAGELPRGATQRLVREALQQLRRTLLLVDSFRTQCELRSGVVELADLLQCVIVAWRDSFKFVDPLCPRAGEAAFDVVHERAACLRDLESLLHGLRMGSPASSRGLQHSMDALLMQCVVAEAIATGEFIRPRAAQD